jgi:hypothetical protein
MMALYFPSLELGALSDNVVLVSSYTIEST